MAKDFGTPEGEEPIDGAQEPMATRFRLGSPHPVRHVAHQATVPNGER